MTDVGVSAGMLLKQIGTSREIAAFFELIERHKPKSADRSLALVTDRLYRRAVPEEAFDALVEQLEECQRILRAIPASPEFRKEFDLGDRNVGIGQSASNLAAAKNADSDNADANAHGGVLLVSGQRKTPGAGGCGGSGTRAEARRAEALSGAVDSTLGIARSLLA